MILRSGTIMSNMGRPKTPSFRNSFSGDEVNNEGEHSPVATQPLEPVLTLVRVTGQAITTQALSSMSAMAMSTMPMYGLPPGFMPPVAMQAQTQLALRAITTTFQNPLYTNTIMADLPILGQSQGLQWSQDKIF